jgi:hypothetical protein
VLGYSSLQFVRDVFNDAEYQDRRDWTVLDVLWLLNSEAAFKKGSSADQQMRLP